MTIANLPHLAQRLFNVPLAITESKLEVVMAALADRFGIAQVVRANGEILAFDDGWDISPDAAPARDTGYDVVEGIGIIPVTGTLVAKLGTMRPYSGMTGYDSIRAALTTALQDDQVRAIAFDMESPGGEVAGCFDLVDAIYGARGAKPMWSILSEHAYSACYALATATDRIVVPRTGGTGSVGVIAACVDMSQALDKAGIRIELITYGARKADGSEVRPLSKEARARFQADVDTMGELFVETVARNRGLTTAAVKKTEAGTFMGRAGLEVGFADAVMAPDQALRALYDEIS
ncbi:MAG: S49 family peptidase [Dokdonella sp.]|uniref:S49 family peptidase n=1 Tax=Dokdonella sp. TaxID=2291710 RepID=UPI003F80DEC2